MKPRRGYTNIFDAIEQAFNIISDTKESKNLDKGADTIFLMTDGAAEPRQVHRRTS